MDGISTALISKALDGLHMRQTFLAQNIANAGSPKYVQIDVTFESALRQAAKGGINDIRNVEPTILPVSIGSEAYPELRLDMQLAESSKTAMRYSALIEVMARQIAISRSAIMGGQS